MLHWGQRTAAAADRAFSCGRLFSRSAILRDGMSEPSKKRLRLLIIIYLGFVSLGLPDTVLGVAWPGLRLELGAPLAWAGLLAGLCTLVSVLASLAAIRLMKRLSTGSILAACALTTATAMLGYSLAPNLAVIIGFTLLFGLGQGAVDTAVNAHMARHYSARHMNWVHGFWGLGATGGPLIFAAAFGLGAGWRAGYLALFGVQLSLGLLFLATLPWWRTEAGRRPENVPEPDPGHPAPSARRAFFGVAFYFFYPGLEVVIGLWGASYLVETIGLGSSEAGTALALYWGSLTLGRFALGPAAERFGNSALIRAGLALVSVGVLAAYLASSPLLFIAALGHIGLGLSPLYPSMMHETLRRTGPERLEKIIGFQVGAALAGAAVLPALAGLLLRREGLDKFPGLLVALTLVLIVMHELSNRGDLKNKAG